MANFSTWDRSTLEQFAQEATDKLVAVAEAKPVAVPNMLRERDADWFSLVMNAAAEIEDAANCLRDNDAKQTANRAAKHYRDEANLLYIAHPTSDSFSAHDMADNAAKAFREGEASNREAIAELVNALNRARKDINWMLNSGEQLNSFVFDYIDAAITKHSTTTKEQ